MITDSRSTSSCSSSSLNSIGLRDPNRLHCSDSYECVISLFLYFPRVNDIHHVIDGNGSLSYVCGQNDLSCVRGNRTKDFTMVRTLHLRVKSEQYILIFISIKFLANESTKSDNLIVSWKKDKNTSLGFFRSSLEDVMK